MEGNSLKVAKESLRPSKLRQCAFYSGISEQIGRTLKRG